MKALKPLKPLEASTPAKFMAADAEAIQALFRGEAGKDQQKRALKWILEDACGLPVWGFRETQRETDIALGRHFVGQQIVGLSKIVLSKLKDANAI